MRSCRRRAAFSPTASKDPRYTFGEFLIEGSGGSIRPYPDGTLTLKPLGQGERKLAYKRPRRGFSGDACHAALRHFIDRLRDGKPFESEGEEYLKTLAVQEAVYESAAKGVPIDLRRWRPGSSRLSLRP
jgi:predicted dehydrogenase